MICTRCEGTGFLNLDQINEDPIVDEDHESILKWLEKNTDNDVQVCDCCGDGEEWYGEPGEHFTGGEGRECYDYNGGLPECN